VQIGKLGKFINRDIKLLHTSWNYVSLKVMHMTVDRWTEDRWIEVGFKY